MIMRMLPGSWMDKAQAAAIGGTALLHLGLGTWALYPSPPIAMPAQQVIEIALISPSTAEPAPRVLPETPKPIPTADTGTIKVPKKKQQAEKPAQPQPEQVASIDEALPMAEESSAKPAAVTEPVFDAAYLRNPVPVYPSAARRQSMEGKVMLDVAVSAGGEVENVAISRSSGFDMLDEAARQAVQNWRFLPARRGDEAVAANVTVPVVFKITQH